MIGDYFHTIMDGDKQKALTFFCRDGDFDTTFHNGYRLEDFLDYEIAQFEHNSPHFKLTNDFTYKIRYSFDDLHFYSFYNSDGNFVFDYPIRVKGGLIVPDNSHYQVVPKILFRRNDKQRSIAVSCPQRSSIPHTIIPKKLNVIESRLVDAVNLSEDGFRNYIYKIEKDTFCGASLEKFRFVSDAHSETASVLLSGVDHPDFITDMYADIGNDGKSINMPDTNAFVWSVAGVYTDGDTFHIEFPKNKVINLPKYIEKIILTDALDNDWHTSNIEVCD